jgi:hypothetical protein
MLLASDVEAASTQCWVTTGSVGQIWYIHVRDDDYLYLVDIKHYDPSSGSKTVWHWVAPPYEKEVCSDGLPMLTDPYEEYRVRAMDKLNNIADFVVDSSGEVQPSNQTGVGGLVVPVNKLVLLEPYIGSASTMLAAAVAIAIYVKRVKHRKEK